MSGVGDLIRASGLMIEKAADGGCGHGSMNALDADDHGWATAIVRLGNN